jgi:hypothetical protein
LADFSAVRERTNFSQDSASQPPGKPGSHGQLDQELLTAQSVYLFSGYKTGLCGIDGTVVDTARAPCLAPSRIFPGRQHRTPEKVSEDAGLYGISCSSPAAGSAAHTPVAMLVKRSWASPSLGVRWHTNQSVSELRFSTETLVSGRLVPAGSDSGCCLTPKSHLDRRIQLRLGRAFQGQTALRPVIGPREMPPYKLFGDDSGRERAKSLPPIHTGPPCSSPLGQHICGVLREPPGRCQIQESLQTDGTPSRVGSSLIALAVSGHINVGADRLSRDNIPPGEWSLHPQTVQSSDSPVGRRPLCVERQRALPEVFLQERGRAGPDLAQLPAVSFPSDLAVTTGTQEYQGNAPLSASHSSAMGDPDLVPRAGEAVARSPMADPGEERSSLSSRWIDLASPPFYEKALCV